MRVTRSESSTVLAALTQIESNLSQTQNQISSNLGHTPSQNPVAAGSVNNYDQALAQSQQYDAKPTAHRPGSAPRIAPCRRCKPSCRPCLISRCRPTMVPFPARATRRYAAQASPNPKQFVVPGQHPGRQREYIFGGFSRLTDRCAHAGAQATPAIRASVKCRSRRFRPIADGDNGNIVFNQIKTATVR